MMHTPLLKYRVYSHNIRYNNRNPVKGEELWEKRRVPLIASLRLHSQHNSTLISLQEVLHDQLEDILAGLGDDWSYFGVGRDDGKKRGEYAPILFNKTEWEIVKGRTWWLSETPEQPSRGWDAALPRIMTFVRLKHVATGREVGAFNTHYDHAGPQARRESSKLIMEKMKTEMGDFPVTLSGDFNSDRKDTAYKTLSSGLVDTGLYFEESLRYGHKWTYSGFDDTEPSYIDFTWFPKDSKNLAPTAFGILEHDFAGFKMSDHRPVVTDFAA